MPFADAHCPHSSPRSPCLLGEYNYTGDKQLKTLVQLPSSSILSLAHGLAAGYFPAWAQGQCRPARPPRHNEILPSALNWANCVYTITCKQANATALLSFNGAGSGNYSLFSHFTADWFASHNGKNLSLESFPSGAWEACYK